MKKTICLALVLTLLCVCLAGCAKKEEAVELNVFAAASLKETLTAIGEQYKSVAPNVTLHFNFDSSGTLKTQIAEGADCDLFLSAAPKQMNQLDGALKDDTDKNPDGLDLVLQGTRCDLLENKVVLVVPEGDPAGVASFDELAETGGTGFVPVAAPASAAYSLEELASV